MYMVMTVLVCGECCVYGHDCVGVWRVQCVYGHDCWCVENVVYMVMTVLVCGESVV